MIQLIVVPLILGIIVIIIIWSKEKEKKRLK